MTAQDLVNAGYYGYAGWGDAEAAADFAATGGAGKGGPMMGYGGGSPEDLVSQYLNTAMSPYLDLLTSAKPYEEANPFFFDEELAKEAATAEYAPYYGELISDYIADVETTKSRSAEDLERTLSQLSAGKEYYTGRERRVLDKAMRMVDEGYAGRGLFFSGARERDIKDLQTEYEAAYGPEGYQTGRWEYQAETAKLGTERTLEDVLKSQERYTRDIEREKKYAIEAGVLQRKGEAREEYEWARKKYYSENYPALYGGVA